jgi:hypothetical protein
MEYMILIPTIFIAGAVLGYWLATHIHSVANAAARATTVPSGTVDALNSAVKGLGDAAQTLAAAAQKPVVAAIDPKA